MKKSTTRRKRRKKTKTKFQLQLEALSFKTYPDYLKSDHWLEFRKAYFAKHKKVCYCCGKPARDLHHIDYSHLGNERHKDCKAVCAKCHDVIHRLTKNHKVPLSESHLVVRTVFTHATASIAVSK